MHKQHLNFHHFVSILQNQHCQIMDFFELNTDVEHKREACAHLSSPDPGSPGHSLVSKPTYRTYTLLFTVPGYVFSIKNTGVDYRIALQPVWSQVTANPRSLARLYTIGCSSQHFHSAILKTDNGQFSMSSRSSSHKFSTKRFNIQLMCLICDFHKQNWRPSYGCAQCRNISVSGKQDWT